MFLDHARDSDIWDYSSSSEPPEMSRKNLLAKCRQSVIEQSLSRSSLMPKPPGRNFEREYRSRSVVDHPETARVNETTPSYRQEPSVSYRKEPPSAFPLRESPWGPYYLNQPSTRNI